MSDSNVAVREAHPHEKAAREWESAMTNLIDAEEEASKARVRLDECRQYEEQCWIDLTTKARRSAQPCPPSTPSRSR